MFSIGFSIFIISLYSIYYLFPVFEVSLGPMEQFKFKPEISYYLEVLFDEQLSRGRLGLLIHPCSCPLRGKIGL